MTELPVNTMPEFEMAEFDVTCHTEGCVNKDITLRVNASKLVPVVYCGPCSAVIEDVISVGS